MVPFLARVLVRFWFRAGFVAHARFDWTSVELKLFPLFYFTFNYLVLIEPVWNWNHIPFIDLNVFKKVLIEPVWNWNLILFSCGCSDFSCFDWTSVELKQKILDCILSICFLFWLNQCGIETQKCAVWQNNQYGVLIEPVWNWNPIALYCRLLSASRFDWTSVELKLNCLSRGRSSRFMFWLNQCGIETRSTYTAFLQLALFWLNQCGIETKRKYWWKHRLVTFWLNQCGIETYSCLHTLIILVKFWLNQCGIETNKIFI